VKTYGFIAPPDIRIVLAGTECVASPLASATILVLLRPPVVRQAQAAQVILHVHPLNIVISTKIVTTAHIAATIRTPTTGAAVLQSVVAHSQVVKLPTGIVPVVIKTALERPLSVASRSRTVLHQLVTPLVQHALALVRTIAQVVIVVTTFMMVWEITVMNVRPITTVSQENIVTNLGITTATAVTAHVPLATAVAQATAKLVPLASIFTKESGVIIAINAPQMNIVNRRITVTWEVFPPHTPVNSRVTTRGGAVIQVQIVLNSLFPMSTKAPEGHSPTRLLVQLRGLCVE